MDGGIIRSSAGLYDAVKAALYHADLAWIERVSLQLHEQDKSGSMCLRMHLALQVSVDTSEISNSLIFEQDPVQILDALLPLYMSSTLLRSLQVHLLSNCPDVIAALYYCLL